MASTIVVRPQDVRPPNRGRLKNGNPSGDYRAAPRCGARTRAGCSCRQPAMPNGRCRFHGGKSTGPRTAGGLERCRRARLTHGFRSAEVIDLRKAAAAASRRLRALLSGAPPAGHGLHRRDLRVVAGTAGCFGSLPRAAWSSSPGGHTCSRIGAEFVGAAGGRPPIQRTMLPSAGAVRPPRGRPPAAPTKILPRPPRLSAGHGLHRHDSRRCEPATGSRPRCNIRVHLRSSAAANL